MGGCCSSQRSRPRETLLTVWQSRIDLLNHSFWNFGFKTGHQAATELETNGENDDDTAVLLQA